MKEPYGEGVATHTGPESCAAGRETGGEALTGVRTGRALSRENPQSTGCRRRGARRKVTLGAPKGSSEAYLDPARSKTPSTSGNTSHGSREIPRPPAAEGRAGRTGKSKDARR